MYKYTLYVANSADVVKAGHKADPTGEDHSRREAAKVNYIKGQTPAFQSDHKFQVFEVLSTYDMRMHYAIYNDKGIRLFWGISIPEKIGDGV